MKTGTIVVVREILKQKVEDAKIIYEEMRCGLELKYETEWLESEITEQEKLLLEDARANFYRVSELLDDFENHQW